MNILANIVFYTIGGAFVLLVVWALIRCIVDAVVFKEPYAIIILSCLGLVALCVAFIWACYIKFP